MTGENKNKELTEEQKNAKELTAKAMENARQARLSNEAKKLDQKIRKINMNKGGKAMKPITMNMGGQVEGVEDLTTEFEVTD